MKVVTRDSGGEESLVNMSARSPSPPPPSHLLFLFLQLPRLPWKNTQCRESIISFHYIIIIILKVDANTSSSSIIIKTQMQYSYYTSVFQWESNCSYSNFLTAGIKERMDISCSP